MSLVAVRVRELAEGGEDGGRVLLGDARGLRRVSGGVRARNGREKTVLGDNREDGGLELTLELVAFDVRREVGEMNRVHDLCSRTRTATSDNKGICCELTMRVFYSILVCTVASIDTQCVGSGAGVGAGPCNALVVLLPLDSHVLLLVVNKHSKSL